MTSNHSYIYMVITTGGFLEVAIESWPEWGLNPRPHEPIMLNTMMESKYKVITII